MEAAAIFALVQKGLTIIGTLIQAGQSATPAIEALSKMVAGAQAGTVTEDELLATEDLLDKLIDDFNEPLPEE